MSVTSYIAVGSNIGDRRQHITRALHLLAASPGVMVRRVSTLLETEPVGGPPGQDRYLNGALEVESELAPEALLGLLLETETRLGRVRSEPNAPRTLDLDLLLHGNLVHATPNVTVPHPRMHERSFVLDPLAEIAGQVRHPLLGVTIRGLSNRLRRNRPLDTVRAFVTGSTSGIGLAMARTLAAAGAWVIVHGRRGEVARAIATQVSRDHDIACHPLTADLAEPSACPRLADDAWNCWGGLELLICNAGADTLTGSASAWTFEKKLAALWQVDVEATIALSRGIGERMRDCGISGHIITIGWDQAEAGMEGASGQLFAASKGAVMAFTRSLAVSLAPQVRVNCIAPGWIRTAWGEGASEYWQERARREAPLARWGTPEDVAATALWLAQPASSFITGQIIRVDGGAVRA